MVLVLVVSPKWCREAFKALIGPKSRNGELFGVEVGQNTYLVVPGTTFILVRHPWAHCCFHWWYRYKISVADMGLKRRFSQPVQQCGEILIGGAVNTAVCCSVFEVHCFTRSFEQSEPTEYS